MLQGSCTDNDIDVNGRLAQEIPIMISSPSLGGQQHSSTQFGIAVPGGTVVSAAREADMGVMVQNIAGHDCSSLPHHVDESDGGCIEVGSENEVASPLHLLLPQLQAKALLQLVPQHAENAATIGTTATITNYSKINTRDLDEQNIRTLIERESSISSSPSSPPVSENAVSTSMPTVEPLQLGDPLPAWRYGNRPAPLAGSNSADVKSYTPRPFYAATGYNAAGGGYQSAPEQRYHQQPPPSPLPLTAAIAKPPAATKKPADFGGSSTTISAILGALATEEAAASCLPARTTSIYSPPPPATPATPTILLANFLPVMGGARRRLADDTTAEGATPTNATASAAAVSSFVSATSAEDGTPTPSAPWLVQEALSVKAAVDEAVRAFDLNSSVRGGDGYGNALEGASGEGGEVEATSTMTMVMSMSISERVEAKVPPLDTGFNAALGRVVSTREAEAWVRALDRLEEGLDRGRLLETCLDASRDVLQPKDGSPVSSATAPSRTPTPTPIPTQILTTPSTSSTPTQSPTQTPPTQKQPQTQTSTTPSPATPSPTITRIRTAISSPPSSFLAPTPKLEVAVRAAPSPSKGGTIGLLWPEISPAARCDVTTSKMVNSTLDNNNNGNLGGGDGVRCENGDTISVLTKSVSLCEEKGVTGEQEAQEGYKSSTPPCTSMKSTVDRCRANSREATAVVAVAEFLLLGGKQKCTAEKTRASLDSGIVCSPTTSNGGGNDDDNDDDGDENSNIGDGDEDEGDIVVQTGILTAVDNGSGGTEGWGGCGDDGIDVDVGVKKSALEYVVVGGGNGSGSKGAKEGEGDGEDSEPSFEAVVAVGECGHDTASSSPVARENAAIDTSRGALVSISSRKGQREEEGCEASRVEATGQLGGGDEARARNGAGAQRGMLSVDTGGRRGRWGARRNASKIPDDVIAKVPCLSADINTALGRYVTVKEVKDCLRSMRRCGEEMSRQSLLDSCLEQLGRNNLLSNFEVRSLHEESKGPVRPPPSPGSAATCGAAYRGHANNNNLLKDGCNIGSSGGDCDGGSGGKGERQALWRRENSQLRQDGKMKLRSERPTSAAAAESAPAEKLSVVIKEAAPFSTRTAAVLVTPSPCSPSGEAGGGSDSSSKNKTDIDEKYGTQHPPCHQLTATETTGAAVSIGVEASGGGMGMGVEVLHNRPKRKRGRPPSSRKLLQLKNRPGSSKDRSIAATITTATTITASIVNNKSITNSESRTKCNTTTGNSNINNNSSTSTSTSTITRSKTFSENSVPVGGGEPTSNSQSGGGGGTSFNNEGEKGGHVTPPVVMKLKRDKKEGKDDGSCGGSGGAQLVGISEVVGSSTAAICKNSCKKEAVMEGVGRGDGRGGGSSRHRRVSKRTRQACITLPGCVVAKVPRLLMDLETFFGYRVSTEEAKTRCRELDRCGEGFTQQELCHAVIVLLLHRATLNGGDGIAESTTSSEYGVDGNGTNGISSNGSDTGSDKVDGSKATGENVDGGGSTANGNNVDGDDASGNHANGGDASGNHVNDDDASGSNVDGNDMSGNHASCSDADGNNVSDSETNGNNINGSKVSGNNVNSSNVKGNNAIRGKNASCNNAGGNNLNGSNVNGNSRTLGGCCDGNSHHQPGQDKGGRHEVERRNDPAARTVPPLSGTMALVQNIMKCRSGAGVEGGLGEKEGEEGEEREVGEERDDEEEKYAEEKRGVGVRGESASGSKKRLRIASGMIPCSVIPKIPRLMDLGTTLGHSVSAQEAKAACRRLDRCGEDLCQEEPSNACISLLCPCNGGHDSGGDGCDGGCGGDDKAGREIGKGMVNSGQEDSAEKKVSAMTYSGSSDPAGSGGNSGDGGGGGRSKRIAPSTSAGASSGGSDGGGIGGGGTSELDSTQRGSSRLKLTDATPQMAVAVTSAATGASKSVVQEMSDASSVVPRPRWEGVRRFSPARGQGGEGGETTKHVDVSSSLSSLLKKPMVAAAVVAAGGTACKVIPDSVLAELPRLVVDLETFVGYPMSIEEAKACCRELDRCGENLTQHELCNACVSVFVCRDINNLVGGSGDDNGAGGGDCGAEVTDSATTASLGSPGSPGGTLFYPPKLLHYTGQPLLLRRPPAESVSPSLRDRDSGSDGGRDGGSCGCDKMDALRDGRRDGRLVCHIESGNSTEERRLVKHVGGGKDYGQRKSYTGSSSNSDSSWYGVDEESAENLRAFPALVYEGQTTQTAPERFDHQHLADLEGPRRSARSDPPHRTQSLANIFFKDLDQAPGLDSSHVVKGYGGGGPERKGETLSKGFSNGGGHVGNLKEDAVNESPPLADGITKHPPRAQSIADHSSGGGGCGANYTHRRSGRSLLQTVTLRREANNDAPSPSSSATKIEKRKANLAGTTNGAETSKDRSKQKKAIAVGKSVSCSGTKSGRGNSGNKNKNIKLSKAQLQCEVGEFAVFPTTGSSAPFLVGKVLHKRHINLGSSSHIGSQQPRTDILVHWFTPKKATPQQSTFIARKASRGPGPIHFDGERSASGDTSFPSGMKNYGAGVRGGAPGGNHHAEDGDAWGSGSAAATAAAAAVWNYASGGWSGVLVQDAASKRLIRDTGLEDLAAATLVFPKLLQSNAGLPASVRDTLVCVATAAALAAELEFENRKSEGNSAVGGGVESAEKEKDKGGSGMEWSYNSEDDFE